MVSHQKLFWFQLAAFLTQSEWNHKIVPVIGEGIATWTVVLARSRLLSSTELVLSQASCRAWSSVWIWLWHPAMVSHKRLPASSVWMYTSDCRAKASSALYGEIGKHFRFIFFITNPLIKNVLSLLFIDDRDIWCWPSLGHGRHILATIEANLIIRVTRKLMFTKWRFRRGQQGADIFQHPPAPS